MTQPFNGLGLNLANLPRLPNAGTRSFPALPDRDALEII